MYIPTQLHLLKRPCHVGCCALLLKTIPKNIPENMVLFEGHGGKVPELQTSCVTCVTSPCRKCQKKSWALSMKTNGGATHVKLLHKQNINSWRILHNGNVNLHEQAQDGATTLLIATWRGSSKTAQVTAQVNSCHQRLSWETVLFKSCHRRLP